jgi:ketosteroid isomerase-like protein
MDHVETLRGIYAEWARGNFAESDDVLDPDLVFILRPEFPDAGVYHGTAELRRYMQLFLSAWTGLTITPEEFIEAGDSVVVGVHQHGVGLESQIATEFRYFQVWTFRGPKVIRLEGVRTREEALEAVGLAP